MNKKYSSALTLLEDNDITVLDAVRIVKNILDSMPNNSAMSEIQFCNKIIEIGKRHFRTNEMQFEKAFSLFLEAKSHLRKASLRDIKYIGNRLIRSNPTFAKLNFSELSRTECETWLSLTFKPAPQFNKARAFLHAMFEFAIRHEWCEKNPIKLIEKRKIIEREIIPLSLEKIKSLIKNAESYNCIIPVALLTFAGIRPNEIQKLTWHSIDIEDNSITIHSKCSKTGGTRQIEICPSLKNLLRNADDRQIKICPNNWKRKWKIIRDKSGFKNIWIQDILRHTYASYYAKYYRNLSRLQLNMGHRDHNLLLSRYVNMKGISSLDAKNFFTLLL